MLNLGEFPFEDSFIVLHVPDDDPFRVSKVIAEMRGKAEAAKVYASHSFLSVEDLTKVKKMLRLRSNNKVEKETEKRYIESLLKKLCRNAKPRLV